MWGVFYMNRKILIIIVVAALLCCVGAYVIARQYSPKVVVNPGDQAASNNTTQNGSGKTVAKITPNKEINVVLSIADYLKTAHKGQEVSINYVVTNKGTKPIHNVILEGQSIRKELGTIQPGQTVKVPYREYIWTDAEVKEDFGPDATVHNPYGLGGGTLYYTDYKGIKHTAQFGTIEIKLV